MKLTLQLFALLLSGCSAFNNPQQSCKIIDPDLSQGVYRGGCENGWADGYGEVTGTGSYHGDFLSGKKNGKGIKVMANGDRYTGEFLDDYRHGQGIYVWGDKTQWAGDRYDGEYQRDLRHGWGIFQWNNGDRYEGQWKNDLRMGPSVMELRREQAEKANVKSATQDITLCAEEKWDLTIPQLIRGKVEKLTDTMIWVRITEIEGGFANYHGTTLTAGDLFTDKQSHWHPCEQN